MLVGMEAENEILIVAWMRVECGKCGHAEDDTHEFEVAVAEKAPPRKERVPSKCPACGAPVLISLNRTKQVQ